MLFVEAGAWFQELVSKVLPKSKVDLFYGTDYLVIAHICDRLWENRPLRALLQNRVIGIQG